MMEATSSRISAALLLVAGVYQLTPLKHACLRACQSPLGFLMSRWRDGRRVRSVWDSSTACYCVGCCWALMLLLFAGGVMNLSVIAALTAFVAFEKLAPLGLHGARDQRLAPDRGWIRDARALNADLSREPVVWLNAVTDHCVALRSGQPEWDRP